MRDQQVLEHGLQGAHEWIRSADQKAVALLTMLGFLVALLAPYALHFADRPVAAPVLVVALSSGSVVAFLVSLLGCLLTLYPRVATGNTKVPKPLTFFGYIATTKEGGYFADVNAQSLDAYLDEMIAQTHISGSIAAIKHRHLKTAVVALGVALALAVLALVAAAVC